MRAGVRVKIGDDSTEAACAGGGFSAGRRSRDARSRQSRGLTWPVSSAPAPALSRTHVGKPAEAVSARFDAVGADGVSVVVVTDAGGAGGERMHTCEVDAAGRVLAIRHPGA